MKKKLMICLLLILPLGIQAKAPGVEPRGHCQVAILPGCQKCERS